MTKKKPVVSVRVRCEGALHTISITPSGAVVLHDHPDIKADRAFEALGGEPCRCLKVLETWRRGVKLPFYRRDLPAGLRPAFDAGREKAAARRRRNAKADPLSVPFATRAAARVARLAGKALETCSYRRSRTSWAGGNHEVCVRIGDPVISGSSSRVWSHNGKWPGTDSYVSAAVPLQWFSRVWRRGLAVVDGCFVLDVLSEDDKGFTVLAGKQGRGFEVHPARAKIIKAKDGSYRLRWLKGGEQA
ncbi:hypothetical protein Tfer_0885 [Thermincola ferriacetica]|uniref:Uncharacterized protein n=1 Tax=Thermincola ferriacetica TaxID=281456 RepID=A0A0L6W466_9FIRM|nr:hypothetical protein [Thermincola ferriacetica]KNZ70325.1 hypothetical protein Tfer_0885 [Thermincola ferriacetica]